MKTAAFQKRKGYLVIGGIGTLLAVGYLGLSLQLPFGQMDQPGAAVFPIIVGITLLLASLSTLWEGWRLDSALQVDLPTGTDRKRLLSLIGLLFVYFFALPWLGQIIASTLLCVLLIRLLSDLGWPRTIAYSLAISFMLYGVFVFLLKVPMPQGVIVF